MIGTFDRRAALRHSALLSAGALGAFVCNFAKGLFTPYILDPVEYGTLNILSLVILYASYTQLGTKHAATLLIPSAMREGRQADVDELRDSIFTAENLLSVAVAIALWGMWGLGVTLGGVLNLFFVCALSAVVLVQRFDLLLGAYLKGLGRFDLLAQNQFFTSFFGMLFGVPLLVWFGIEGMIVSLAIPYLLVDGYIVWKERIRFRPSLKLPTVWRFTRVGFPVYVGNFVGQYLWTLEKTLIAILLSTTELGLYSFALLVFGPINLVPKSFNEVIKRRMAEFRGIDRVDGVSPFLRFFRFPMAAYLALSITIAGCAFFFFRVLALRLYPNYAESVFILTLLLFGFPYFQLRLFTGYPLNILNRSWLFVGIQASALGVNAVIDYVLILRYGLVGAAVGSSVSYVLFGFAILYAVHAVTVPERALAPSFGAFTRVTVAWTGAFAVLVGLVGAADRWVEPQAGVVGWLVDLGVASVSSVVFGVATLALFSLVYRSDRFREQAIGIVGDAVDLACERLPFRRAAAGGKSP